MRWDSSAHSGVNWDGRHLPVGTLCNFHMVHLRTGKQRKIRMGDGVRQHDALDRLHVGNAPMGADPAEHSARSNPREELPQARYVHGERFYCKIVSVEKKEVKDIGYPIPSAEQNFYELHRLNTKSFDREFRLVKDDEEML